MIKFDAYAIVSRAVEEGIKSGMYRSYKHVDDGKSPDRDAIEEKVYTAVMDSLSKVLKWEIEE
jgi:hypothetical protein